jgi:hypothetical protein
MRNLKSLLTVVSSLDTWLHYDGSGCASKERCTWENVKGEVWKNGEKWDRYQQSSLTSVQSQELANVPEDHGLMENAVL